MGLRQWVYSFVKLYLVFKCISHDVHIVIVSYAEFSLALILHNINALEWREDLLYWMAYKRIDVCYAYVIMTTSLLHFGHHAGWKWRSLLPWSLFGVEKLSPGGVREISYATYVLVFGIANFCILANILV